MFEFFPGNYAWSRNFAWVAGLGGELSEIEEVCRPLRALDPGADEIEHYFQAWHRMGTRLERLARVDDDLGHSISAARKYLRAELYFLTAEAEIPARHPRRRQTYLHALEVFRRAIELDHPSVEFVEVPFERTTLPSLFIPAEGATDSAPCMLHFDGSDDVKELTYLAVRDNLCRRGISTLICDHPGSGGALRLRQLGARHDIEVAAAACIDYLERRSDVDSSRIGIVAQSLGGYYAPRAAAFEKRLKCCVAWGAIWDAAAHQRERERWYPSNHEHRAFMFQCDDPEELERRTELFTLEGVAEQITCPLLIVHGENDRQVPLRDALKLRDAATASPRCELKVFTLDEGGAEHCQIDTVSLATDYIHDWAADVLHSLAESSK